MELRRLPSVVHVAMRVTKSSGEHKYLKRDHKIERVTQKLTGESCTDGQTLHR
jgi:hypothetical protein